MPKSISSAFPAKSGRANKIDAAGHSLLDIINECLDFSKIEANLLEIEEAPFRLTDIFDNLANIMSTSVGAKPVEVCIAPVPDGADYLRGDRIRLMQILMNLVSNAIKFTEQGEVVVEVKIIDSMPANKHIYLSFLVRDTGIGIPADKQESIFHPFMQADNSTTRVYGGTGLGLTISRRLVELMGGTLQLKSQEGVGSEFSFGLVLTVSNIIDNSIPLLNYQQVLIADDNETARKVLESLVVSLGWNAFVVDSGEKALEALATKGLNYFDLLLLDWRMPKIDGIEVVTRIQDQLGKKYSPVIIMVTAYDRDLLLTQPNIKLIDNIISKPVTSSSLFNALLEAKIKKGELLASTHKQDENNQQLLGLNLLVVDDSEINRDVAYQILSGEGANIELAVNGLEAVNLLLTKPNYFHVVLMDVQMPIMDGYATTRQIRSMPELSHLPIIALTAGAFKTQHDAALDAGMNDFIAKPFEAEELVACIKRMTKVKLNTKVTQTIVLPKQTLSTETMPLIDVEHALKKWQTVESYQKNLRLFLQQHAQDTEDLNNKLLANDKTAIKAISHKLRGSAGALSLKRMVHFVEKIEDLVNEQNTPDAAINDFTSVFLQTIEAINGYLNVKKPPIIEQKIVQDIPTSVITKLTQLLATLDSDDANLIEAELYALSGKLPKESFEQLQIAVENFDFRGAEIIITALMNTTFNKKEDE